MSRLVAYSKGFRRAIGALAGLGLVTAGEGCGGDAPRRALGGGSCETAHTCDAGADSSLAAGGAAPVEAGAGGSGALLADTGPEPPDARRDAGEASAPPLACPEGYGDCNGRADDACEVNLRRHPNHCGACGRTCLGGECHDGQCDPVLLAGDQRDAEQMTLHDGVVYWIANPYSGEGAIRSVPREGGAIREIATDEALPADIAVLGDRVFWTNRGDPYFNSHSGRLRLRSIAADAGPPSDRYTGAFDEPSGLNETLVAVAVDATHVYWAVYETGSDGEAYMRQPIAGGPPQRLFPEGQGYLPNIGSHQMHRHGNHLIGVGINSNFASGGFLSKVAIQGGAYEKFWQSAVRTPFALAVHEDTAYFSALDFSPDVDIPAPYLFAVSLDGGEERLIADGGGYGVAVDPPFVYYSTADGIRRVPLDGGEVEELVNGHTPFEIAVDDEAVYWVDGGEQGAVWKVAK